MFQNDEKGDKFYSKDITQCPVRSIADRQFTADFLIQWSHWPQLYSLPSGPLSCCSLTL